MSGRLDRSELERWHRRRSLALAPGTGTGTAAAHAPADRPCEWRECDLVWEQCQEQAALAARDGDRSMPPRLWARALEIAEHWFERGDPRLATSLTNRALVLRRRGQVPQAEQMFAHALKVWDEGWRWIGGLAAPSGGRYDHEARAAFAALIRQGRAATAALEHYDPLSGDRLALWFELRPRRLCDLRKLLGAVLLIASDPH